MRADVGHLAANLADVAPVLDRDPGLPQRSNEPVGRLAVSGGGVLGDVAQRGPAPVVHRRTVRAAWGAVR